MNGFPTFCACVFCACALNVLAKEPPTKPAPVGDLVQRGMESQRAGQYDTALQYYRQAEIAGDWDGAFQAGRLLRESSVTARGKAKLLKQQAAMDHFHRAATNLHAGACLKLSQAFQEGWGVTTNRAMAYVWLKLAHGLGAEVPLPVLDELAVQLNPEELQQAQFDARQYRAGAWPRSIAPRTIEGDSRFRISGVSTGAKTTVLINRVTFREGDTASVVPLPAPSAGGKPAAASLQISCAAIGPDYVLIRTEGEADLRLLALDIN